MFWKKKIENNWNKKKISLCLFLFWEKRKWFNFLFLTFQPNTFVFFGLVYYIINVFSLFIQLVNILLNGANDRSMYPP